MCAKTTAACAVGGWAVIAADVSTMLLLLLQAVVKLLGDPGL